MSKYLRVTHTYLVPMPDDLPDNDPQMETAMSRGISMMEDHMKKLYADPRRCVDLLSTWELIGEEERQALEKKRGLGIERADVNATQGKVPKRIHVRGPLPPNPSEFDRITALGAIEGDFDRGVSFAQDIMGQREAKVPHPWDQGLFIFPEGHPLRAIEEATREKYERVKEESPNFALGLRDGFDKHKELESGGEDEVSST